MDKPDEDLGLSDGRLAEIELALVSLPHSVWRNAGKRLERASLRGDGQLVAEFESIECATFCAMAPEAVRLLILELGVAKERIEKMKGNTLTAHKAALSARAELGEWKDKYLDVRRAWRELTSVLGGGK